jgi:hypothetical protein
MQLATTTRNAILDAIETEMGTGVIFKFRTGTKPATCATADSGTVLASVTCPADYFNDASNGSKTLKGSWTTTGIADGVAGHYRIYASDGTTCKAQGAVGVAGDSPAHEVELDNLNIAVDQTVTMTAYTLTAGFA